MTDKPQDLSVLTELGMALTRTLSQSAFYSPSHHQSRNNIDHLVNALGRTVQEYPETSRILFISAKETGADDVIIAGLHHRPISLSSVLKTTMGAHLRAEFMNFVNKNEIAAISIHRQARNRDFESFVDLAAERIMAERAQKDGGEPETTTLPLGTLGSTLRARDVVTIQLVHVPDVLGENAGLDSWLPRVLLSEIRAILDHILLVTGGDETIAGEMIGQLVRTHVLQMGGKQITRAILLGGIHVPAPTGDRTISDILCRFLPPKEAITIAWELAGALTGRNSEDEANANPPEKRLLRALLPNLNAHAEPKTKELLKMLQRDGLVSFKQLPEPMRDRVRIAGWTDQYLSDPAQSLHRIENIDEREAYRDLLTALRFVFRELIKRKDYDHADELLAHLKDIATSTEEPFQGRIPITRKAVLRMLSMPRGPIIAELTRQKSRDERLPILALLSRMGLNSFYSMVSYLHQVKDDDLRRELLDAIRAMGPSVVPLVVSELSHLDHPWVFHRDMISILADIGDANTADAVRKAMEHPNVRVRQMAVDALARLLGEEGWAELIGFLPKSDLDVQNRIVRVLAHDGCRGEDYFNHLLARLNHWATSKEVDERELHACFSAIDEMIPFQEDEPNFLEAVTQFTVSGKGRPSLLKRKTTYSESLVAEATRLRGRLMVDDSTDHEDPSPSN